MIKLAISLIGFYAGFSEDDMNRHMNYLKFAAKTSNQYGGRIILLDCASFEDAVNQIDFFVANRKLDILPYQVVLGKLVFFSFVRKHLLLRFNSPSVLFRSDGTVIIDPTGEKPVRYYVDPKTFKPDRKGLLLLRKYGSLMFYRFRKDDSDTTPEKLLHIIEKNGKFVLAE